MQVFINAAPAPNEIEVSGEAVALVCLGEPERLVTLVSEIVKKYCPDNLEAAISIVREDMSPVQRADMRAMIEVLRSNQRLDREICFHIIHDLSGFDRIAQEGHQSCWLPRSDGYRNKR
jgi:hypothetical protein